MQDWSDARKFVSVEEAFGCLQVMSISLFAHCVVAMHQASLNAIQQMLLFYENIPQNSQKGRITLSSASWFLFIFIFFLCCTVNTSPHGILPLCHSKCINHSVLHNTPVQLMHLTQTHAVVCLSGWAFKGKQQTKLNLGLINLKL